MAYRRGVMEVDLGGETLQMQKVGHLAWAGAWSLEMSG